MVKYDDGTTVRNLAAERIKLPTKCAVCGRPRGFVPPWAPTRDIFACCLDGDLAQLERVVEAGEDLNPTNERGETPACAAAEHGHASILRYLHSQGADLRHKSHTNNTVLSYAGVQLFLYSITSMKISIT